MSDEPVDWMSESLREALTPEQKRATRSRPASFGPDPYRVVRTRSNVLEIRQLRGLTQRRLALIVGVDPDTIRKAEQGFLAQMRTTTVIRIANGLGVGAADLFPILASKVVSRKKFAARTEDAKREARRRDRERREGRSG